MVTQRNACFGSWKCGKGFAFTTFPQPLFLLFLIKLTGKITQKEGEDCAERANPIPTPVSEDFTNILLTIPYQYYAQFRIQKLKNWRNKKNEANQEFY